MKDLKVVISIDAQEDDLYEFSIVHDRHTFRINCFLHKIDDILLLTGVDVEGPGQGTLGKNVHTIINAICDEFCNLYQAERVIILGAKRTVGRTKGSFFRPIYRKQKND